MPTPSDVLSAKTSSDVKAQIDALRNEVAALINARANPIDDAVRALNDKAREIGGDVREHAETLSTQIRERPMAALLVAAGIGYLIGRLAR